MTTKSKNKNKSKPTAKKITDDALVAVLASLRASTPSAIDKRKELLASVAGAIAAGLVTAPSPSIATPSTMAMAAVDIADEILKKAGIPSVEASAESSSSDGNVGVGAAS